MSKKLCLRMAASLVCLAFLLSLTPALSSAEQSKFKPLKPVSLTASFRLLSYLFPLIGPFVNPPPDRGRAVDKVAGGDSNSLVAKSTDEATSIGPKTKD